MVDAAARRVEVRVHVQGRLQVRSHRTFTAVTTVTTVTLTYTPSSETLVQLRGGSRPEPGRRTRGRDGERLYG